METTLEAIVEELVLHMEAYEAIDLRYEESPDEIKEGLVTIFDDEVKF